MNATLRISGEPGRTKRMAVRNERHAEDQRRAGKLAKAGRKTKSGSLKTQLTLAKQGIDKPLADPARKAAAMSANLP